MQTLQPLLTVRLRAHQVGEERAQCLHLRVRPRPLLAQLARSALQVRLGPRPRRTLILEAHLERGLRFGRLDAGPFLKLAIEAVRSLELGACSRFTATEICSSS